MQIFTQSLIFISGLFILVISSNYLIQVSVKLAQLFRLTMLFIGAVLIAFGTSAPEAGVGIIAAIRNLKGIALGNIIGSNIANIGLIIGLCAFIRPIAVAKNIFKREAPLMLLATLLFYGLGYDLNISRFDGLALLFLFFIFCFLSYRGAKQSFDDREINDFTFNPFIGKMRSKGAAIILAAITLAGVVWGADIMVRSGSRLAVILGVPTWIIGITVFAVGTSLPELVTSLGAAFRGVSAISVGNIVGSNIFNLLFVMGVVALIRPFAIDQSLFSFEMPLLLLFTFVFFTVMRLGYKIKRWEGMFLFAGYIIFLFFLLRR